jgi:hypothetical protein
MNKRQLNKKLDKKPSPEAKQRTYARMAAEVFSKFQLKEASEDEIDAARSRVHASRNDR